MPDTQTIKMFPSNELHFDRRNPRMAEYGLSPQATDEEVLSMLWEAMDVREIVMSIAASGFFKHETLIVAEEEGRLVVIEGNRRLAAVRVLLNPELAQDDWRIPEISKEVKDTLQELPAVESNRQDAWRFLGFKHVNGPAKWTSYAKAQYVAGVHREYGVPLGKIASQIGDAHRTVQRLYRGLMVLQQAQASKAYDVDDRYRTRLAFSHLYTGLDYDGFQEFLSLKPETDENDRPVPEKKLRQLGEVCLWLYGSKKQDKAPVVETQNPHLRQLNDALKSSDAVAALRDGADISYAFELSRSPVAVFEEALLRGKRELLRAKANLATGYDKTEGLLRVAGTIATIADSIYDEMDRMRTPDKKERIRED